MQSDELDDLFRQQFDGHASEPGADLWARLQARTEGEAAAPGPVADADLLDAQFRAGLAGHATPPRRELWERLEDEHLRPRQRRRPVVAWGRLAVAASLLLFLLAGGAGLWWRSRGPAAGSLASQSATPTQPATGQPAAAPAANQQLSGQAAMAVELADPARLGGGTGSANSAATALNKPVIPAASQGRSATGAATLATSTGHREKKERFFTSRATASPALPSSHPIASTARMHRPASSRRLPQADSPLDATGNLLARHQEQPAAPGPAAAPSPTLAAALTSPLAVPQVIEVEVRHGAAATRPAAVVVATAPAADETPDRPRLRLGGVLRQAGRALRGEPVSLTDATADLPETVTVQARLGGRTLSKTIRF